MTVNSMELAVLGLSRGMELLEEGPQHSGTQLVHQSHIPTKSEGTRAVTMGCIPVLHQQRRWWGQKPSTWDASLALCPGGSMCPK